MFKRISAALFAFALLASRADATQVSVPYSFIPNSTIYSAQVNANFSTIYNAFNSGIDNTNVGSAGFFASQIKPTNGTQATFGGTQTYTFPAAVVVTGALTSDGIVTGTQLQFTNTAGATNATTIVGNGGITITGVTDDTLGVIAQGVASPLAFDHNGNLAISGGFHATTGNFSSTLASGAITAPSITLTSTPLAVSGGGTGTASPALTAGTGLSVSGSFPAQQFALSTPVSTANGGNGTTSPALTAGTNLASSGSWAAQTLNVVNNPTFSGLVTASAGISTAGIVATTGGFSGAVTSPTIPLVFQGGTQLTSSPHVELWTGTTSIGTTTQNFHASFVSPPICTVSVGGGLDTHIIALGTISASAAQMSDQAVDTFYLMCEGQ